MKNELTYEAGSTDTLRPDAIIMAEGTTLPTNYHGSAHITFTRGWRITADYHTGCTGLRAARHSTIRASRFQSDRLMGALAGARRSPSHQVDPNAHPCDLRRYRWSGRCSRRTVPDSRSLYKYVLPETVAGGGTELRYRSAFCNLQRALRM